MRSHRLELLNSRKFSDNRYWEENGQKLTKEVWTLAWRRARMLRKEENKSTAHADVVGEIVVNTTGVDLKAYYMCGYNNDPLLCTLPEYLERCRVVDEILDEILGDK